MSWSIEVWISEKHTCEVCGKIMTEYYGSGRFCCLSCKQIYSSRFNKVRNKSNKSRTAWNKGLTKETDPRVKKYADSIRENFSTGRTKVWCEGKSLPDDMKSRISSSMKTAHEEGRAHNIGECRWNNEPSYPEKFFTSVIENEFEDKNYVREYPIGIYSADFAWVDKKKVIEIDGQQHSKESYHERDLRKDEYLRSNGWDILRVKWIDMYNDTKKYIGICKEFIDIS